jgi:hypothetical protein
MINAYQRRNRAYDAFVRHASKFGIQNTSVNNMKKLLISMVAAVYATISFAAVTSGDGNGNPIQVREFSLNNEAITLTHVAATTNASGSVALGKLPEGLVVIHGTVMDIGGVMSGVGTNTTVLKASVGIAAATSSSLTGTVATLVASSDASTGWTNRVTKIQGLSTAVAVSDGTAAAKTLYLNVGVAVSTTNGALSANGKVRVIYSLIGDK